MLVENKSFPFLVTHVEADGNFLMIWAQTNEQVVQSVNALLRELQSKLNSSYPPSNFTPNTLCCAQRPNSSEFCRARILRVRSDGMLRLFFVDYGIVTHVPHNSVRLLNGISEANYLFSIPDTVLPFVLADVKPVGGYWMDDIVLTIRSILVGNQYVGVFKMINNCRIIKFKAYTDDFSKILINRNMAEYSGCTHQMVQASIPVQPMRTAYQASSATQDNWRAPITSSTTSSVAAVKAIQLEINSLHNVRVSYVEEGPCKFSVQLLESIPYLNIMMDKINSQTHLPLQEPPIAGAVCLGRQTHTNKLCRVVLNSPGDTSCKVYFADYGHHEVLPFTSIYQIPDEFVVPNVYSIRFTLSGIMNWTVSQEMKDYFGGLVTNEILKLKVCKGPMSPLTQYCDLYLKGKNIKDILFENFSDHCIFSYCEPKQLQKGSTKNVFVSYVISPVKFFVQLDDDLKLLDEISDQIEQTARTAQSVLASQIYRGMPCIALYDVDKKWYRASIIDIIDSNRIKVFYVDYGNEEIISINSLRTIPENLVKMLPKQAIRCTLHGILLDSIDQDCIQNFKTLVNEERLSLTIQDVSSDGILVHLYDRKNIPGTSGKNISEKLNDFKAAVKQNINCGFDGSSRNNQDTTFTPLQFRNENENKGGNWEKTGVQHSTIEAKNPENCENVKSKSRKDNENEQRHDNRYRKGGSNDCANEPQSNRFDKGANNKFDNFGHDNDRFCKNIDFQGITSQGSRDYETNDRFNRGASRGNIYDANKFHSGRVDKEQVNKSNFNITSDKVGSDKDSDTSSRSGSRRNGRIQKRNTDEQRKRSTPDKQLNNCQQIGTWENEEHINRFQNLSNDENISITDVKSPNNEKSSSLKISASNSTEMTRYFTSTPIFKIPPPNITIGAVKNCELVYYTDSLNFYLQLCPDNEELHAMSNKIQAIYKKNGKTLQDSEIKTDLQCVAQYSKDKLWYRAIVKSVEFPVATVQFVDYGNVETICFDKIKEIETEFLKLPAQAIHCKLFCPSKVNWSKEENDILSNELHKRLLEAEFITEENGIYEILVKNAEFASQKFINDLFSKDHDWLQEKDAILTRTRNLVMDKMISPKYSAVNEKWLENQINLEKKYDVLLAWFINPENFYCQLISQQVEFRSMMNEIQSFYENVQPVSQPLEVGSSVIAVLPEDGVLYRAEILELNKPRGHVVQYVDYGDRAMVDPRKIYPVDQKFRILPKQALFCGLKNIASPCGSNWTCSPEITKLFISEKFECVFHEMKQDKYLISLMDKNSDLASTLVNKNLAVFLSTTFNERANGDVENTTTKQDQPKIDINLLEGQTLFVKVSNVEGVSKFYVQFYTAETCQSIIDTFMAKNDPEVMQRLLSHEICIGAGSLVCCHGKWRRCVVINCNKPKYEVRLIDTGEREIFTLNNMLGLPGQLAIMQYQAIECVLHDVPLSSKADDWLKKNITGKDVKIFVEKVVCNRLHVRLFDVNGNKIKVSDTQNTERINPVCSMQILSSTHDVIVTYIKNSKSVWLQRKADEPIERRLLNAMYDHYSKTEQTSKIMIEENKLYAALSYDKNWYRVKVTKVKMMETVAVVVLIDYGNEENVPFDNFRTLESQFYLPCQLAVEVSLTVKIEGSDVEQQKILDSVFGTKVFSATFYNFSRKWVAELSSDGEKVSDLLASLKVVEQVSKVPQLEEVQKQLPDMQVGERYKIFVSHIDNPSQLWLQRDEEIDALEELQEQLQIVATAAATATTVTGATPEEKAANYFEQPLDLEEKTLCLALYTYDNRWYRAEVLDSDSKIVTVRFIDYGNTDVVDNNPRYVIALPDKWKSIQRYATQCKLDVLPANTASDWSEEACKKTTELLADARDALIIADKAPMRVDLFLADERSICKILIEAKLAEPVGSSNLLSGTSTDGLDEQKEEEEDEEVQLDPRSAFVSCCASVDQFYMQEEKSVSDLEMMENRFLVANMYLPVLEIKVGLMCVAKFSLDDLYYRAIILSHDNEGTRVCFIDYGNTSFSDDLRTIPDDLVEIRPLARKCRLAKPDGLENWPANINEEFKQLANDGATVFLLDVIEEGEKCLVRLTVDSTDVALELLERCARTHQAEEHSKDTATTSTVETTVLGEERPSPIGQENSSDDVCIITHVNSPSEFWIQNKSQIASQQLRDITKFMANAINFDVVTEIEEGQILAAKFYEDDLWYRSKVLSHGEAGTEVFYIDYGNSAMTDMHSVLRKLPDNLAQLPPLATRCSLKMPENLKNWPKGACEKFIELSDSKTELQLRILSISDLSLNSECPIQVSLFIKNQDITDILLSTEILNNERKQDSKDKNASGDSAIQFEIEQHGATADNLSNTSSNSASATNQNFQDFKDKNTSGDSAFLSESEQLTKVNNTDQNLSKIVDVASDMIKTKGFTETASNIKNKMVTENDNSTTDLKKSIERFDNIQLTEESESYFKSTSNKNILSTSNDKSEVPERDLINNKETTVNLN